MHKPKMSFSFFIGQAEPKPAAPEPEEVDLSQVIGMVIALIAIIYTLSTSLRDILRKKKPIDYENESKKENELQKFLKSMEAEDEEELEESEEEMQQRRKALSPPLPPPEIQHAYAERKEKTTSRGWPRPEEKFVFHTKIEDLKPRSAIDERKLEIKLHTAEDLISEEMKVWGPQSVQLKKRKEAPVHALLKTLASKQALIVAAEIIQPPVGFRKPQKFP